MNILITGASGLITGHFLRRVINEDHRIICVTRDANTIRNQLNNNFQDINIVELKKLTELKDPIDVIIHTAAIPHYLANKDLVSAHFLSVGLPLQLLNQFSKSLKRFIYLSTIHVYGDNLSGWVSENSLCNPKTSYAVLKLLGEQSIQKSCEKLNAEPIIIRLANSFGYPVFNNQPSRELVVNQFCYSAFKNKKIVIRDNDQITRDFVYVENISYILNRLLTTHDLGQSTLNIASSEKYSLLDIAKIVKSNLMELTGQHTAIISNGHKLTEQDYNYSTVTLKNLIPNWEIHTVESGIRKTLTDLIENRCQNFQ